LIGSLVCLKFYDTTVICEIKYRNIKDLTNSVPSIGLTPVSSEQFNILIKYISNQIYPAKMKILSEN